MPYPSTLQAVWEFRHQMLLEDAARERRTASAVESGKSREGFMFGECHQDSIIQRGVDEALACQDMLARAPAKPSLFERVLTRLAAAVRVGAARTHERKPRVTRATSLKISR